MNDTAAALVQGARARESSPPSSGAYGSLHCPYCGSGLETIAVISLPNAERGRTPTGYGVLRCGCSQYPIVDGIPILQHIEGLHTVVQLVKQQETRRALLQAMNVFRVKWAHRTRWHQGRYYLDTRRLTSGRRLSFEDAVTLVRKPTEFADYLFHRNANPSFLTAMSLLPLMGRFLSSSCTGREGPTGHRPRVLDLACGAGHSSFLISLWFPDVSLMAADQDFVSLYLAKRFMAPTAEFVCIDSEAPSPFPAAHFDAVHCLDAFHYFKSKKAIVGELQRICRRGALWLFPHLHNALQENVTAGVPLSPEHWARCFEAVDPILFDEADLLRQAVNGAPAPRASARSLSDLSRAKTLALVSGGVAVLDEPERLATLMRGSRASLRVNPIYRGAWSGGTLHLRTQWPNAALRRECSAAETILPATCVVGKADLEMLDSRAAVEQKGTSALLSRFVLVPLAPGYGRRDVLAEGEGIDR